MVESRDQAIAENVLDPSEDRSVCAGHRLSAEHHGPPHPGTIELRCELGDGIRTADYAEGRRGVVEFEHAG